MKKFTSVITSRRLSIVILMTLSLLIVFPWQRAFADIGDKPSLSFEFVFEANTQLTITEGILYTCTDISCVDRQPLQELGPQRFSCTETSCSTTTYGHPDFMQLEVTFSDGITRRSGVFSTSGFHVKYLVTVRESELTVVEESARDSRAPSIIPAVPFIMYSTLFVGGLVIVVLVTLIVLLGVSINRSRKGIFNFKQSRWVFILSWVLAIPLIILGGFATLTIPLTVVIEAIIAFFYARNKRFSPLNVTTLSILVNVLTLTGMLFVFNVLFTTWEYIPVLIFTEIIIWVIEASLFKLAFGHEFSWKQSFGLSTLLNVPTLLIGLFLPIP